MIYRKWFLGRPFKRRGEMVRYEYEGWFLFGLIPLYIHRWGIYPYVGVAA